MPQTSEEWNKLLPGRDRLESRADLSEVADRWVQVAGGEVLRQA